MPPDEVEHLVERDAGLLRGPAHGDLPLAQAVEGVVDPGLPEPSLDEAAEGLRAIRLEPLRESIDFAEAFLGQTHGHRLAHVYDIISCIQIAYDDIGSMAASELLGKRRDADKEFFNDLFEAKVKYITTRP